ncbi:MAG: inositol monophosphatase [Chloroflexi bacterium]|nr:inositol monophosphatase [Chloroflexota bacterium]MCZ7576173.1 inositol monophosphatase [Dehalococcoidia bacterium]
MDLPTSSSGADTTTIALQCADVANRIIQAGYGQAAVAGVKGRGNVVTETDLAVERAVTAILAREFPGHAVLSEETAAGTRSDGWMWIVDPLDGTKNFSRGIPHFAFTIALCFDSEPVVGLTTHPLLGDTFLAVRGQGTTLNGARVTVTDCATVQDAVVAVDLGYNDARAGQQLATASHLWPGMQSLRVPGSAALGFAYLAAGKWDIYLHSDLEPWDVAAGLILVREAGGVVRQRDGAPATIESRAVVAATPAVYADFAKLAGHLPWAG